MQSRQNRAQHTKTAQRNPDTSQLQAQTEKPGEVKLDMDSENY